MLLKNEIKNDEMRDVLCNLQQYVPMDTLTDEIVDPDDNETITVNVDNFHYILFGGDQLTAERATGAKRSLANENRGCDRLEGLVPIIEDWHSKVCFLKVNLLVVIIATFLISHACTLGYLEKIVQYFIGCQYWYSVPTKECHSKKKCDKGG